MQRLRRSPALPSLKGKVARERRKGLPRISEGGFRRSGGWLGTRMVALIAAWLTPQSPSVTAPLSGAPRLRRSPALPSLKGKVARERRKGLPRISEGGFRRSGGWLGTRMVALIAAWLTPQSPSVTAPLSGAPRLRRSPALPSLKGKVARERRKGLPRISEGGVRRSEGWLGTRMVAFIAAGLTPQSPSVTAPLSGAPESCRAITLSYSFPIKMR